MITAASEDSDRRPTKILKHLPVSGTDALLIKTFGESNPHLQKCNILQPAIKTPASGNVYISGLLQAGVIESVPTVEVGEQGKVHYLPDRKILRVYKKIRVV